MTLKQHLHDTSTYIPMEESSAKLQISKLKEQTCAFFLLHYKFLDEQNLAYFRFFLLKFPTSLRIPQFYRMPKVHKNKIPTPLRPVISQCGSFTAYISTWLDITLQPLKNHLFSYIRNSTDLLNILDKTPKLPKNAKIVTTDATSMYTNISTTDGIATIRKYLDEFANELPHTLPPTDLICSLLEVVMTTNIFQFGNTWWKQIDGTAMGTPCACIYSTLYFGYYERKILQPKYKDNLLFYKRQIDDILIIWKPTSTNNIEWPAFVSDLNNCSSLKWETEKLGLKTNFLDITITFDPKLNKLKYTTYQKPSNLFLYIPPHSAHPKNTIKSLIYGLLKTYNRQNPNRTDFNKMGSLLYKRLRARGHHYEDLKEHFKVALHKLKKINYIKNKSTPTMHTPSLLHIFTNPPKPTKSENQLFLHLQFHPKGISRRTIQKLYSENCTSNPNHLQFNITTQYDGKDFKNSTNPSFLTDPSTPSSPTLLQHLPHLIPPSPSNIAPHTEISRNKYDGFEHFYNPNTGSHMEIKKLTIAYSRPKNLRDTLCPSKLLEFPSINVNNISKNLNK